VLVPEAALQADQTAVMLAVVAVEKLFLAP
jgi:hypothetical protein